MISFGSTTPLTAPGATSRVVVEALIHRGELASVEFKEARVHGTRTAILVGLSCALLLLGGFCGTFAIAAAVWDRPDRGMILGLVTVAYLAGAGAMGFVAARRLKTWQPFTETARQFREDCSCVHDIANSRR
jgi:uncharacterized membrane protein YqjE